MKAPLMRRLRQSQISLSAFLFAASRQQFKEHPSAVASWFHRGSEGEPSGLGTPVQFHD